MKRVVFIGFFSFCFLPISFNGVYYDPPSNYISQPPFPSFQALKLPFSYSLTQSSFVSHTRIYKPCSPLLWGDFVYQVFMHTEVYNLFCLPHTLGVIPSQEAQRTVKSKAGAIKYRKEKQLLPRLMSGITFHYVIFHLSPNSFSKLTKPFHLTRFPWPNNCLALKVHIPIVFLCFVSAQLFQPNNYV